MAGPKITRLGDPANPYGGKRTPTAAPTPQQAATNRARSQRMATTDANAALRAPKATPKPAAPSGGIRQRQIDAAVDSAVLGKPRKPR